MVVSCDVHIYTVVNKAKPEYTNKDCYVCSHMSISSFNSYIAMAAPLNGLIFDAVYGRWILSLPLLILVNTPSRLSIAQASFSFKCHDTYMPTYVYVTHTFITKALYLATYVQLF